MTAASRCGGRSTSMPPPRTRRCSACTRTSAMSSCPHSTSRNGCSPFRGARPHGSIDGRCRQARCRERLVIYW
eukprot:5351689-Prymnesium_polylepis.1